MLAGPWPAWNRFFPGAEERRNPLVPCPTLHSIEVARATWKKGGLVIQLVIAWTCVGVFVATAGITLLALVRVIRLAEKKYLDRLFKALILEIVGVCIGIFTGKIELPRTVEERVIERGEVRGEEKGREAAVEAIRPELQRLSKLVEQRDSILQRNLPRLDLNAEEKEALKQPVKLDPKIMEAARTRRIAER